MHNKYTLPVTLNEVKGLKKDSFTLNEVKGLKKDSSLRSE